MQPQRPRAKARSTVGRVPQRRQGFLVSGVSEFLGFRVLGLSFWGFGVLGFRVLGVRASCFNFACLEDFRV